MRTVSIGTARPLTFLCAAASVGIIGVIAGCDPNWTPPSDDGGDDGESPPMVYACHCSCWVGIELEEDAYQTNICAIGAPEAGFACSDFCDGWDVPEAIGQLRVDCSPILPITTTEETCSPEADGQSLDASGDPESTDATLDGESTAEVTFFGERVTVSVDGRVELSGGCATGECPISFSQIRLNPADFTVRSREGRSLRVSDVTVVNVGGIETTLTDGIFVLPRSSLRVHARAEIDGVVQALVFTPTEDLEGHYLASRGILGLHGELVSSAEVGLSFDLASRSLRRPPSADAGPAQRLVLSTRATTGIVSLDGSRSSDPDGNLHHVDWYEGSTYLGRGSMLRHPFARGRHVLTAVAVDSTGKRDVATTTVSVR